MGDTIHGEAQYLLAEALNSSSAQLAFSRFAGYANFLVLMIPGFRRAAPNALDCAPLMRDGECFAFSASSTMPCSVQLDVAMVSLLFDRRLRG